MNGITVATYHSPTCNDHVPLEQKDDATCAYCTIKELARLLELARCPDNNCDGAGTCSRWPVPGHDGEADIDIWQCQWCDEKKKALQGVEIGR